MAKSANRNDNPIKNFSELVKDVNYSDFKHQNKFSQLCKLIPNTEAEKLEIESEDRENMKRKGLVYILVINNKIYKIGETRKHMKERIGSYNCGKLKNRKKGTASTGNYFELHSLLNIGCEVHVYVCFAEEKDFEFFAGTGKDFFPSPPAMKKKDTSRICKRSQYQADR